MADYEDNKQKNSFTLFNNETGKSYDLSVIKGTDGPDVGNGWAVAGVSDATKDRTLVRKCNINQGNTNNMYDEFTIKELKDKLSELDLSTSGNKQKLIQRLVSHKK